MKKYTEEELITIIDERLEDWIFAEGNHACDRHMNVDVKTLKNRVDKNGAKYSSTFTDTNNGDDIIREIRYRLIRNIANITSWVNESNNDVYCLRAYIPYNIKGYTYSLSNQANNDGIQEVKKYVIVLNKKYASPFFMVTAYPSEYISQFTQRSVTKEANTEGTVSTQKRQGLGTYSRSTTKGHCVLCATY